MVIQEASTYKKTFKCPYCNFRADRIKLIKHIDKYHSELIPEDYTATRIVFNLINKKDHGTCTECGCETKWNESKARYERLCGSEKCHQAYLKKVKSRMVKVYGVDNLLGDPKHQEKMLANRKISGVYKFKDGGEKQYTGSYEKKALEFFDNILNVSSDDIITPGPVLEYEFEGKKHIWITDIFYIPYRLVIEIKDGGSNPNNRPMQEYRSKQIAKEEAITKGNQYNYLRLTNNNFAQLLEIFGELKMQLIEDNKEDKIIKINEDFCSYCSMMPKNPNNTYIVNYMQNNVFSGSDIAFSPDETLDTLFRVKDGKLVKESKNDMVDAIIYGIYEVNNSKAKDKIIKECGKEVNKNFILEACTDSKIYTADDFKLFDFKKVLPVDMYYEAVRTITEATIKDTSNKGVYYPVEKQLPENVSCNFDENGKLFLKNDITNLRTESKDDISSFNEFEIGIIEKGDIL